MPPTVILLICCEGGQTEPQYFKAVIDHLRVRSKARVYIVGGLGQHLKLVEETNEQRNELARKLSVGSNEIEAWAVCDKDTMACSLAELEKHAGVNNVSLAFTDPKFEVFLLQHFRSSSTGKTGAALDSLLAKELDAIGMGKSYNKKNLNWVSAMLDQEPKRLDDAISNASKLNNPEETPYITVQNLLKRLQELAPGGP